MIMGENHAQLTEFSSNILKLQPVFEYRVVKQKVHKTSISINTLPDELLLEILYRLSCANSAFRCKSVCKRWACLISTPFFIASFTLDKKRKRIELFSTSLHVYSPRDSKATRTGLTIYLEKSNSNSHELSLHSLPTSKDGNPTAFTIHASCNDLLVYFKDELGKQDYYICNIRTHLWLLLPTFSFYYRKFQVAFSCDPYCNIYHHGDFKNALNPAYKYSIVVLPFEPVKRSSMRAHLFSNTNNEWSDLLLLLPQPCQSAGRLGGFAFDAKLHFVCLEGIVGFDPYDNKSGILKCHIIAWPMAQYVGPHRIGECQGKLRLMHHVDDKKLLVWCLKDYKKSEWSLQNSIEKEEWIIRNECVSKHHSKQDCKLDAVPRGLLAFHPTNPDVFYALYPRWIVVCKLSERSMEIVARVRGANAARVIRAAGTIPIIIPFQSMHPSWPTPLPVYRADNGSHIRG